MNWQKNLAKIFSLIFLMISVAACNDDGCVEADEFDNEYVRVDSNPTADGITGAYDATEGGQVAEWHNTNLRSNGEDFLILISGAWTPWNGESESDESIKEMSRCRLCAKREMNESKNCICYLGQNPIREISSSGNEVSTKTIEGGLSVAVDCSSDDQNNPSLCSCTTKNGKATDYGVFHFPLTFYDKNHNEKAPDDQEPHCKYDAGLGLYLGLFGVNGANIPIRAYHMFSEESICSITRNSNGECVDSEGNDFTKYVFRSANNKIFVKNDNDGNAGTDSDPTNDTYHLSNEYIKMVISDRYYSDNYGRYNVSFLRGVAKDKDTGLLEYLVKIVEDIVLGKLKEVPELSGVQENVRGQDLRTGGMIEFTYKAIVNDTYFALILQASLSLYLVFFAIAHLFGLVELSKKELLSRLLKISLIIFFTTATSWEIYKDVVVGFFKDGMDGVIGMFSGFVDNGLAEDSPIKIAQEIRAVDGSNASRFAYVDSIIKSLFSENVTKKIWGLLLSSIFGFIYILAIYATIAYFIYVALVCASAYAVTLMKLVFALSLGPIFILFATFSKTEGLFKKWLGFLGTRSMEIVMLFLMFYIMISMIDQKFGDLLSFRVCIENLNLGIFPTFKVYKAHSNKELVDWLSDILTIAGFILALDLIVEQIPKIAGSLVQITGYSNKDAAGNFLKSSFAMAKGLISTAFDYGKEGGSAITSKVGGGAFRAVRAISRKTGISGAIDAVGDKIPVRGPRTRARDGVIDSAIKNATKEADAKKLSGPARDQFIRNSIFNSSAKDASGNPIGLHAWRKANPSKAAAYDMDSKKIMDRINQKLIDEPLKKAAKEAAKEIKKGDPAKIPLGKDMEIALKEKMNEWADKNLSGGAKSIEKNLENFDEFKKYGKLDTKSAAKKFAGRQDLQDKYLQHLAEKKMQREAKDEKGFSLSNKLSKFYNKNAEKDFVRNVNYQEKRGEGLADYMASSAGINSGHGLNPLTRLKYLDRSRSKFDKKTNEAQSRSMQDYLAKGGYVNEKNNIEKYYNEKSQDLEKGSFYETQLRKQKDSRLKEVNAKRDFFKKDLEAQIKKSLKKEMEGKDDAEKDIARKKAMDDYNEALKKQIEAVSKAKPEDILKNGAETYKDGLIADANGKTLFEAEVRLKNIGIRPEDINHDQVNATNVALTKLANDTDAKWQAGAAEMQKIIDESTSSEEARKRFAELQSQSILPSEVNIKVGISVADAFGIPAGSTFTPVGGSIMIGADFQTQQEAKQCQTAVEKMRKTNLEVKSKTKQYDKRLKELERSEKEKSGASKSELAKIDMEIDILDKECVAAERELRSIAD